MGNPTGHLLLHPSNSGTRTSSDADAALGGPDPLADIITGTATETGPAHKPSGLCAPLWRLIVTSEFGERVHPVLGTKRFHRGTDYGARAGTPIRAAADGTIVWANRLGAYGNLVVVDHGAQLHTAYGHLESISVQVGQQVTTGRRIGRVGSTGLATGPHLHFEVRRNGTPTDPSELLTGRLPAPVAAIDAVATKLR